MCNCRSPRPYNGKSAARMLVQGRRSARSQFPVSLPEIERLFRRLKGFRRIFSRFDKLDLVFIAFIYFALVIEALR
jgi:hypothetical protein